MDHKETKVTVLDSYIDIQRTPLIRAAKLIHVKGTGALRTRSYSKDMGNYDTRYFWQVMFNDTPLVQVNAPECPTCADMLATGYGISNADSPELEQIQEKMNEPFVSLEDSIDNIRPLLGLLESGLYVIADMMCYPTDGIGNFFWNVPNKWTENPATATCLGSGSQYGYETDFYDGHLEVGIPVFMYPTQDTDCYDASRVEHYIEAMKDGMEIPRAILYGFESFLGFLLDGHHKACAAAALRLPVHCLVIIPENGFQGTDPDEGKGLGRLFFNNVKVYRSEIPEQYWFESIEEAKKEPKFKVKKGTINHRKWEAKYLDSASSYPDVFEYAAWVAGAELMDFPIEDAQIYDCLISNTDYSNRKLRFILHVLDQTDPEKFKEIAALTKRTKHGADSGFEALVKRMLQRHIDRENKLNSI